MATVYSDEVAVGSYNRIRIKCDYSGTSASITIQFRRTSGYSTTWYSDFATLTFNGQTKSAAYSYSGYVGTDWVNLRSAISGYSISTSGGTYSWNFYDGASLGCSGSIYIPSQGSTPSDGYVNDPSSFYKNSTGINIVTSSAGVKSDGGASLTELYFLVTEQPYTTGNPRKRVDIQNGAGAIINNNSASSGTAFTIVGNKQYYVGVHAGNSAGGYNYNGGPVVTVSEPFQVSVNNITSSSAVINYATTNDGGAYAKYFEYSIDGGKTWGLIEIVTGSSIVEHTYQLTGLKSGKTYVLKTRVRTTAGITPCDDVMFSAAYMPTRMYGSVSSSATRIAKFLVPVNGSARYSYKIYGSVDGLTKLIYRKEV